MALFDTHAHLDDDQIAPIIGEVLKQAESSGLCAITAIGTTVESSKQCLELAKKYSAKASSQTEQQSEPKVNVYASVGIHPNKCKDSDEEDWAAIAELATRDQVVAIGETGLDRYWDYCPIEIQEKWFARHIELSFQTEKPLVIHMRDCEADILRMLDQHKKNDRIIGIMHSFAGSWETAQQCLELGMYISFAGMVTFKKSNDLRHIASRIPDDRILVETDSPYLSPHPHRSVRPNQPAMVEHTARCIAEVRGMGFDDFADLTTANAKTVFGLTG